MNARLAALVLVGGLAACAGPRPLIPDSAAVVAPAQWLGTSSNAAAVAPRWWERFDDPVLNRLIETALAANTDIAIAAARVREAEAQFDLLSAQQRPNIALVLQGARSRSVSAFGRPQTQTAGEARVNGGFDIDVFGRLRNARRAAQSGVLAAGYLQAGIQLGIAGAVAEGYVGLRALDARRELLLATREARATALQLTERRLQTGYGSVLEARQAEAELRATEQLIPAVDLAIARQEHALALLLGGVPLNVERGVALSQLGLPDPGAGVPAALLRQRPDVAQAEAQLVATDRSLDAVRAAFLPDMQLGASIGVVDSSLLADAVDVYSLGAGLLAPLLTFDRLPAQQRAAAARRDQAAFAYRKTALQAMRDVEDALAFVQGARQQEAILGQQRSAVEALANVAGRRYREGYSPYLEQIDAQRNLLSVELALTQARSDRLIAAIRLSQALGGGWQQPAGASASID
jgi:NodT family efflux transporter outer membrane factor (OMF) lipoprotein